MSVGATDTAPVLLAELRTVGRGSALFVTPIDAIFSLIQLRPQKSDSRGEDRLIDLFARKVVFYGTTGCIVGLVLLTLGHLTGILAVVFGIVLIVIGGRNILRELNPSDVPEGN